MPTSAWIGAIAGAVLGAAAWAAISYFTGYEVGFVAWGIGGAVGGLAANFGSRGDTAGLICAALALVSIFAGKIVAMDLVMKKELEKLSAEYFTRELHTELEADATLFAALTSEAEYPQFMIDRDYSEAVTSDEVTPQEIADFKEYSIPEMQKFADGSPGFVAWAKNRRQEFIDDATAEISTMDLVTEELGLFDIIFGLLGIGTAFKLGSSDSSGSPPRARRQPTQPLGGADEPEHDSTPPPTGTGQAPVPRRRRPN